MFAFRLAAICMLRLQWYAEEWKPARWLRNWIAKPVVDLPILWPLQSLKLRTVLLADVVADRQLHPIEGVRGFRALSESGLIGVYPIELSSLPPTRSSV